jgi:membrane-bound metal-dependent hydrolase YbcI (DUF457 family)
MQFLTHVVVACALVVFGLTKGVILTPLHYVCFFFGSVIPDIDLYLKVLGHRTWTHSLFFVCIGIFVGLWVDWVFWLSAGILVHVALDSLTKKGVYLIYPLPFKLQGFCVTGRLFDWIISVACFLYCVSVLLEFQVSF